MSDNRDELQELQHASQGNPAQLAQILEKHRARLRRMIGLRIDDRVRGRVDASDVIQETYVEASRRVNEYLNNPEVPFFVWLRFLTLQQLVRAHRTHLGVKARDAAREVSLYRGPLPAASSVALAAQLLGKLTAPSQAAIRAETKIRLQQALNDLDPLDREVLTLRHFEQLTNVETAKTLDISEKAACNRYIRALERLRKVLAEMSISL